MKNIFLVLLSVLSFYKFTAQSHFNNALKTRLEDKALPEQFTILVQGDLEKLQILTKEYNYTFNYASGNIASVTMNVGALGKLMEKKIISYAEFIEPRKKTMNDTMLVRNRIKAVKTGAAPLMQAYTGTNVVVGIIDTGIDIDHGDFKDAAGKTRIQFLWDQKPTSGSTVPSPYNYGIEWTAAQINASVCTHNDLPQYGHGTHVSGIAAGNGLANGTHEGCAAKSDIVVVALDFNKVGPTIADAVQYIFSKATALGKPCVINASVGDYYGSHDGTDLEAKLIETMVQNIPGRVMVAAGGNSGNIKYHVKTQPPLNDTGFTWLKNTGTNTLFYWCYADTLQIKNVQISIGANRSTFFNLGRTGFKNYNYGLSSTQNDTLKYNGYRIGIVKTSASINSYGVYELFVRIYPDSANLNWRVESKGVGLHHAWNFDFVTAPLPSTSVYPAITKYVMPDSLYSIVSSFQCLNDVITVANYNNLANYYDVNNVLQSTGVIGGKRSLTSSIGPSRDGKQKPDISATGDYVFSALPFGMQANLIANSPSVVAQGSLHVQGGGTSVASPVVTGLAALYLQYMPTATSLMVKNAVTNCAYSDGYTGSTLPNAYWGYGKLDGKATFLCVLTDVQQNNLNNLIRPYPNPFLESATIKFETSLKGKIYVYTPDGKLLFKDEIASDTYELNATHFTVNYKGILFVRIISDKSNAAFKLIRSN
ncbi:MAG: S8 family peptidase [Bacteroidetes bacterium]|nr:S8 family peptidase [Bacteroidota bacterium]